MPIVTFIDTPGAYPGIDAEERGQSEAIANNLLEMSNLSVPILSYVIGEGGSGGALAIGVCENLAMLDYSIYSVISPEGCASILWKSPDNANIAAEAMCITADNLLKLKLIDEVVPEPLGGAHRDREIILNNERETLTKNLNYFDELSFEEIMNERKNKFLKIGRNDGFMSSTEDPSTLSIKKINFDKILKSKKVLLSIVGGLILISSILFLI